MQGLREVSVADLAIEAGPHRAPSATTLFAATGLHVPPVAFGDTAGSLAARGLDHVAREWNGFVRETGAVRRWRIENALVHGPYGIVTVGDSVIADTLAHIPFHLEGYARGRPGADGGVCIPPSVIKGESPSAWHAAGGNHFNHYHFLLDIVPRLQLRPFVETAFSGTILMSPPETRWQKHVGNILATHGVDVVILGEGEAVRVENLELVSNLAGHGFAPHPALIDFFDRWRLPPSATVAPERRLYLSRRDSTNRRIVNETDVIQLARLVGYEVCEVSSLGVMEQIGLFRSASHIIAPHGAGLANLVFCRPGTLVCELQMDGYLNWCFRALAAVRQVRYGCVVGTPTRDTRDLPWPHSRQWSVPIDMLSEAMSHFASFDPSSLPPPTGAASVPGHA
jgi:hypothetical protein